MKILLVAVNAKYIHSNLGIYSLKAYAGQQLDSLRPRQATIELAEYTINHQMDACLQDIYRRRPDVIGFSCYIWNIGAIRALAADLKKVLPGIPIWFGGPEVSFDSEKVLRENPSVTGVMKGEGEETFAQLAQYYVDNLRENEGYCGGAGQDGKGDTCGQSDADGPSVCDMANASGPSACGMSDASGLTCYDIPGAASPRPGLSEIPGLTYRNPDGTITDTGIRPVMDLSRIPFSYHTVALEDLEHRIIYYESSRGCPFSCSYCLSSIDKQVRFRDLELVKEELRYFLDARVPQVKFVDRTFNCKKSHAMAIWKFIQEHDNGITNFHFEIAADLLGEEEMELLAKMRPGLVQLEIGVQTTNTQTLEAIRRKTDLQEIQRITARINQGRNVHQHLDLIAGLPYEGMDSFRRSFNDVYAMEPEQLQLGFLKVLKGSYMEEMASAYGLTYSSLPPYEVLSTRWLSYDGILELKEVEDMVEVYYNSRQFTCTLKAFEKEFTSPYDMFYFMGEYYRNRGLAGISHNRIARYEILFDIISERLISRSGQTYDVMGHAGNVTMHADDMSRPHCPKQQAKLAEPVHLDDTSQRELETYRDLLMTDLYLRENVKSRPGFARDQSAFKAQIKDFFIKEEKAPRYLTDYKGYDSRQMSKMAHVEAMADGTLVLFDYRNRDSLTYNARACVIDKTDNG
ncbi:B12-binding domain-containing radical SAM protein [Enterocloster hominis (ex Hitch et al. 2024)]|uniref:DUF4080 domain-containing protein n=1 Tax=Enterocloster hominis (ex Hitch et al. 2024) TaxID=1917870 RepID=A0ABV1D976_9FIRM